MPASVVSVESQSQHIGPSIMRTTLKSGDIVTVEGRSFESKKDLDRPACVNDAKHLIRKFTMRQRLAEKVMMRQLKLT